MHALLLDPGGVLTARPYAFRTAAFRPVEAVGVFLCTTVRIILLSTTIPISGLDHMACVLATPGSVPLLAETHAGSLLTCWLGFRQVGLEPSPVLTHWATTTNFMGLLPLPRFRAYLGATTAWFGPCWDASAAGFLFQLLTDYQRRCCKASIQFVSSSLSTSLHPVDFANSCAPDVKNAFVTTIAEVQP